MILLQVAAAAGGAAAAAGGPVGWIVGAAAAVGGAIIGAIARRRQQKKQNKYNREAMLLQHQLEQQAINEQNEYNSPVNQMKRLEAAGLNPNLMYQQGTVGNQEARANYGVPEQSYNNYLSEGFTGAGQSITQAVNQYQAIQMNALQMEAQQIANEKARAELPYASQVAYLRARGLELDTGAKEYAAATAFEQLQHIRLGNKLNEKQLDIVQKRLEEFDKKFQAMDDAHQQSLLDRAIKEVDLKTKEDEYEFGLELTRIQGRLLSAKSISDIDWLDCMKLFLYYVAGGLHIRMPKARDKGKTTTTTTQHADKNGEFKGGTTTTTTTTPNR